MSNLLALIGSKSKYVYSFKKDSAHVILAGNFEITSLRGFLREFFNEDHVLSSGMSVVMLNPQEPGDDLKSLLADPVYSDRVTYVKGSAIAYRSFVKTKVKSAKAVFILTSRTNNEGMGDAESDAITIMRAIAFRKFRPKLPIFAQLILPRSALHIKDLVNHVMCIDELKMGMMAQNCLSPGYSTLLYLITTTISSSIKDSITHLCADTQEYLNSAQQEIYEIKLGCAYAQMSYSEACILIRRKYKATVVAIGIHSDKEGFEILINPTGLKFQGHEHAFVLANDYEVSSKIGTMSDLTKNNSDDEMQAAPDVEAVITSELTDDELVARVEEKLVSLLQLLPQESQIRREGSSTSASISMQTSKNKKLIRISSKSSSK